MKNLTDIVCILDESGSMGHLKSSTLESFNSFIADQKTIPGDAKVTVVTFNNEFKIRENQKNLQNFNEFRTDQYKPAGSTALTDTLGSLIEMTGVRLAALPEDERPNKVVFFIVTDGEDNVSTKFTTEKVKEMITHQQEIYSWTFIFAAANMDAVKTAATLGIGAQNALAYDATVKGTEVMYRDLSTRLRSIRS